MSVEHRPKAYSTLYAGMTSLYYEFDRDEEHHSISLLHLLLHLHVSVKCSSVNFTKNRFILKNETFNVPQYNSVLLAGALFLFVLLVSSLIGWNCE